MSYCGIFKSIKGDRVLNCNVKWLTNVGSSQQLDISTRLKSISNIVVGAVIMHYTWTCTEKDHT